MDSNTFVANTIYLRFQDEFRMKIRREPYLNWQTFIKSKDMGIIFNDNTDEYKITDQKKWTLTKIKYGL